MGVLDKIRMYEAIMTDRELTPTEKVVLFDIHRRCYGSKTSCYPSVDSISSITGISARNIRRNISSLERKDKIKREERRGTSTQYHIVSYPGQIVTPDTVSPLTDCHTTPDNLAHPPLTDCHPNTSNINTDNKLDNTSLDANASVVKKPKKPKKETDPRIKELMNHFHCKYLSVYNEKPHIIGGRDSVAIKRLLVTYPDIEDLKERIDAYLDDELKWMDIPQHSIVGFEKRAHVYNKKNRLAKNESYYDKCMREMLGDEYCKSDEAGDGEAYF